MLQLMEHPTVKRFFESTADRWLIVKNIKEEVDHG